MVSKRAHVKFPNDIQFVIEVIVFKIRPGSMRRDAQDVKKVKRSPKCLPILDKIKEAPLFFI